MRFFKSFEVSKISQGHVSTTQEKTRLEFRIKFSVLFESLRLKF